MITKNETNLPKKSKELSNYNKSFILKFASQLLLTNSLNETEIMISYLLTIHQKTTDKFEELSQFSPLDLMPVLRCSYVLFRQNNSLNNVCENLQNKTTAKLQLWGTASNKLIKRRQCFRKNWKS